MEETNSQSAVSLSTNSTTASSSQDEAEQKDEFPLNDYLLEGVHQESAQRSLLLCRQNFETSFGFALQSYVFKRTSSNSFERITYVDYVSTDSPADRCGIIRGDMVVAVNEKSVVTASHAEIVESIAECLQVSLVLVFKDVARIVELSMRSIQLKFMLEAKTRELKILEEKEKELIEIFGDSPKNSSEISEEAESEESTLYELDEELKNVQNCEGETDYRHLIRINSSTSVGTPQVTRL